MLPSFEIMLIELKSEAKPEFGFATEFAQIASRFFSLSFFRAYSFTFSVSAAKPMRICLSLLCERVFKMSGVGSNSTVIESASFFTFWVFLIFGRISLTAAVIIRMSQDGNSFWQALSISSALCTFMGLIFFCAARFVGPNISVTSQPSAFAASAMAMPILPVEGLLIKRTGSKNSLVGPAVIRHLILFILGYKIAYF